MADTIRGPVTNIVDGDTFDMQVIYTGNNNRYAYNGVERIRIASVNAPELHSPGGSRSRDLLERKLKGREVRCRVQSRDVYSRVVADVEVLSVSRASTLY